MELHTDTLLSVVSIIVFYMLMDRAIVKLNRHKHEQAVDSAKLLLERYGFERRLYLPTIGASDTDLAEALALASQDGYIIVDREGRLAGGVAPQVKLKSEPVLRLVVDNTAK